MIWCVVSTSPSKKAGKKRGRKPKEIVAWVDGYGLLDSTLSAGWCLHSSFNEYSDSGDVGHVVHIVNSVTLGRATSNASTKATFGAGVWESGQEAQRQR